MSDSNMRNMTEGSVPRHLLLFALPMFAGSVLQQLYNMVDSWVVGNYVGDGALAAVGACYPVSFLIISLFMGVSTGGTVVISQNFGAGRLQEVRDAIDSLYTALLCAAVPVTVLFLLLTRTILALLHVEASYYDEARIYLLIVSAGMIGTVGYNANAGILQGLGDSKTPLLFLSVAAVLNTVLDLLSVLVLHMGVAGVALSTVIAQLVSWLFGIFHINRKYPDFAVHPLRFRCKKEILLAVLRIGLPTGLQQATVAFGMIFCVAKINSFGEAYTASYNVGNKIDNFAWLAIQSLSVAVTSFVGQNVGAGKYERVQKGIRTVIVLGLLCCALFMAIILPLRHEIVGFFSKNSDTIKAGGEYLWFIMWGYPMLAVMFCLNSAMRGAGESFFPMVCTIFSMIVTRLPLLYYIADRYGPQNMYLSYDIGWAIGFAAVLIYYFSGRWKRRRRPAAGTHSDAEG